MYKITAKVEGMMCGMCEAHVNEAVRRAFSVKEVNSSHKKGETVIITEDALNEDAVKNTINDTGYDVVSVTTEPYN